MSKVKISQHIVTAIEKHAIRYKGKEIYGWLIGYDDKSKEELNIVASVPCKMYTTQNEIRAEPSNEEVIELSKNIPKGVGIVGIYHSHPNKVFHSTTDNITVKQFASVYPHFLSIVTNGTVTKFYQLKEENVEEINVKLSDIRKFNIVSFETHLYCCYNSNKEFSLAYISSLFRELMEDNIIKSMTVDNKQINKDVKIKKIADKTIRIELKNDSIEEENNCFEKEKEDKNIRTLDLKLEFDIFLSPQYKTLEGVEELIFRGIIDAMYYKLRNAQIIESAILTPRSLCYTISDIPWRFNFNKYSPNAKDLIELLTFRVENMSFKDEKKRQEVYNEIIALKESLKFY